MSNLFDLLNTVNVALEDSDGFDWDEIDRAMTDIHAKLTEPKWAIEDEALRGECEKLVVQWAAKRYLANPKPHHNER